MSRFKEGVPYLVTKTETCKVIARTEAEAEQLGLEYLAWNGGDTEDVQAEPMQEYKED